jgi:hypothetical protein
MKCALELQAIAATKKEEKRRQEAEAEAKRQTEIFNQTIEYCEQIGKKLEEKANAGYAPEVRFLFDYDYYHPNQGYAMEKDAKSLYADKRPTHSQIGKKFDLDVMTKWFDHYCFTVRHYTTGAWRYGSGYTRVYSVIIEPNRECKK